MTLSRILRHAALACSAAGALAATPATAAAATLHLEGDTLVYTAGPGVSNWPSFAAGGSGALQISDGNEQMQPGAGCVVAEDDPTAAECPMPARLRAELGDAGDHVSLGGSLPPIPVEVSGGPGDDSLSANVDVDNQVVLDGGDGDDVLSGYDFGDTLLGGPGADTLTGGAGDDVLRGGDGDDALEPDAWVDVQGDDVVDGGGGYDSVKDWGSSSTDESFGPTITVDGIADDGRPGELDNVIAVERFDALRPGVYVLADSDDSIDLPNYGTSSVEGRGGDDALTGNDGTETIDGGAGADRVEGGYGHDTLTGGPGADTIYGDETSQRCSYMSDCTVVPNGNDTIHARDGESDTIDCGVGNDRAVVDPEDVLVNCETVEGQAPAPGPGGAPGAGAGAGGGSGSPAQPGTRTCRARRLTRLPLAKARARARRAGCRVKVRRAASRSVPRGRVVRAAVRGRTVTLVVSRGRR